MKRGHLIAIVIIVALVAAGVVWYLRKPTKSTTVATGSGSANASGTAISGDTDPDLAGSDTEEPETGYRVIDADARMALLERIKQAREARKAGKPVPAPTGGGTAEDPPPLPGELSVDQVLDGLMPIMPLLKDCYEQGLERRTIKNGQVTFTIKLIGEPDIGTLVDSAELEGEPAFLADAELSQCLHETMMSVELPPMSEGSEATFKTTMTFSDDGEPPDAPPR